MLNKIIAALFFVLAFVSAVNADALKWWQKTIVYQVYPKSFLDTNGDGIGDIKGITSKLDYLKDLGVGAVWITPVYPSPMIDNGYDIANYTAINEIFGSMSDFDELVKEADARGIKIIMDLVFNHTSDKHEWFLTSKQNRTNEKADWYIWRDEPTNWRSIFGGSAWEFCEERGQYYLHTFAKEQPDLNWENPDVRQALFDAANFWLDMGVGGFRVDAIVYIKKPEFKNGIPDGKDGMISIQLTANTPGILDFLHEFKEKVFDGRDIFTVGEANKVSAEELPLWVGSNGVFDMLFEFSHVEFPKKTNDMWCYPEPWNLTDVKKAISASQNATKNNGWYPAFFENHDQPRSINTFFPKGSDKVKAAKALATILLTMRGTPFIFQGEEIGLANANWKDVKEFDDVQTLGNYEIALNEGFSPYEALNFLRDYSRDNARTPMQWNSEKNAGFSSGVPWLPVHEDYKEVNAENNNPVLAWYKKLIDFRKSRDELIKGDYVEILKDSEKIFAFERNFDGKKIITAVNFSLEEVELPEDIFAGKKIILDSENNSEPLKFLPLEARIYE